MKHSLLACLLLLNTLPVLATVSVSDAWIRATVPQQKSAAAYLQITTTSDTRLVELASPLASSVEIHEMTMEKDVMRMRSVPGLDLSAGKSLSLQPGGMHLMLTGVRQQIKEGEAVPITLIFEDKARKRETVTVKIPVRPISYSDKNHARH